MSANSTRGGREAQWNQNVALLEAYKREHGNCSVPYKYVSPEGVKLGMWVSNLRSGNIKVTTRRQAQLDALNFVWTTTVNDPMVTWTSNVSALEEYKAKYGDCSVPWNYVTPSGANLGTWVISVRSGHVKLSMERRAHLDSLGFVWKVKDHKWNRNVALLEEYKKQYGDCLVPKLYESPSGEKLGQWVAWARTCDLTPQRRAQLESLGFQWLNSKQILSDNEIWDRNFAALRWFHKVHGHCIVPRAYKTPSDTDIHVGDYMNDISDGGSGNVSGDNCASHTQNVSAVNSTLICDTENQDNLLHSHQPETQEIKKRKRGDDEELCGVELLSNSSKRGKPDWLDSDKPPPGLFLGRWVNKMRICTDLSPERRKLLEELDFSWLTKSKRVLSKANISRWDRNLVLLKAYREEYGDCYVPGKYIGAGGEQLGRWVSSVRSGNNTMTPERRAQLEAVGFEWKPLQPVLGQADIDRWDRNVAALKEFKVKHKDCRVPSDYVSPSGIRLGKWVRNVRSSGSGGGLKLTEERRAQLTAIGFIWSVRTRRRTSQKDGDDSIDDVATLDGGTISPIISGIENQPENPENDE